MQQFSLSGTWKLRFWDGEHGGHPKFAQQESICAPCRYLDAQVPGEVHLDLMRHGLIQDPAFELNALSARWVEESIWVYRREFDCPNEAVAARAWLCFEQLDLVAKVSLNGQEVGQHCNYHYPCRVEITGKLRPGRNYICVEIESGLYEARNQDVEGHSMWPHTQYTKRNWLRKPQCQFNWDWATRLLNVGISGEVRLEWTSGQVRPDQFVPLVSVAPDLKSGSVRGRWFVENLTTETVAGQLTLSLEGSDCTIAVPVTLLPGTNPVEASLPVPEPRLWWPAGHGDQHLYQVTATLVAGQERFIASRSVGFRRVRVNQEAHPEEGSYFTIEVNGKKIFAKGGNFVPADLIFRRVDRNRYRKLIEHAIGANFNFLRVWGGGQYESDEFYELCDQAGIVVWQDFCFANANYPTYNEDFYNDVKLEATYNVRRLASHPSLIIWCGNNEIEDGLWRHNYDKKFVAPDYLLWHWTFPRLIAEEDPERFYWPSSPYTAPGKPAQYKLAGDQHPWEIGFVDADYRKYRPMICRFASEGGILGPVSVPAMKACLPKGSSEMHSFAWQFHDNGVDTWFSEPSCVDQMIQFWYGCDIGKMSLEQYTYFGGMLKAEGLKEYIESFRRKMFDCSAAIFWMYNDYWPTVRSWTIVDYLLNRTPAYYHVRRAMAPVHVVLAEENGKIVVHGVNDGDMPIEADLRFGAFTPSGRYLLDRTTKVILQPNASTAIGEFDAASAPEDDDAIPFAMLHKDGELVARNRLLRKRYQEMSFSEPEIQVRLDRGRAIFKTDQFAMDVCLDLEGKEGLDDNFFDLYPGMEHTILWKSARPPEVFYILNQYNQTESAKELDSKPFQQESKSCELLSLRASSRHSS